MRYSTTISRCTRIVAIALVATLCAVVAPGISTPRAEASIVGQVDSFATFNGNQYFTASDHSTFDITGDMTFSAWVRPTSSCPTTECVIGTKEYSYIFGILNGKYNWAVSTSTSGSWSWRGTSVTPILNQWQHVAFSVSRSTNTFRFYFNGVLAYSVTDSAQVPSVGPNNGENFVIGARAWSSFSSRFYGAIDEVRLYNTARGSELTVQTDMNFWGPANASGLVAYYDFNEGSGSTLTNDVTGASSATNLTLNGSISWSDVKSTTRVGPNTYIAFPRSYLTSAGTFTLPSTTTRYDYLVVAGGGGGGSRHGGGGGAGGLLTASSQSITSGTTFKVVVGGGGLGMVYPTQGQTSINNQYSTGGADSVLTVNGIAVANALGGGRGGGALNNPSDGGSGGGGQTVTLYGFGTSGQGNNGGEGANAGRCVGTAGWCGGGGGGAGAVGEIADNGNNNRAGNGGAGVASSLLNTTAANALSVGHVVGSSVFFAGGGGGGIDNTGTAGAGGSGGGGGGTSGGSGTATTGTVSTGGGGGGGGYTDGTNSPAGSGGSGVVVIRYQTPLTVADVNSSLYFNGSTHKVTIPDNNALDLGADFTIEAWIYPTSVTGPSTYLVKEGAYTLYIQNGYIYGEIYGGGTITTGSTALTISANTWTHVTLVKSGTRAIMYKNGGTIAGGSEWTGTGYAATTTSNASQLEIGGRNAISSQAFPGYVDNVRIWSYARNANAIATNFNKSVSADVLYMPFDDIYDNVVPNHAASTGSSLNGTLANATMNTSVVPSVNTSFTTANLYGFLPGHAYSLGTMTFAITQNATKGVATVSASTGAFSYVANPGETGSDSFTYSVSNATGATSTTYNISLPTQPMASALSFRQASDVSVTLNTATSLGYNNPVTVYTLGETVRARLTATNGAINLTQGSTTIAAGALNSATVTIDGTQAQVNSALNSATVTSTSPIPTRVTLDIGMKPADQTIGGRTYTYNTNGHFYTRVSGSTVTYSAADTAAKTMSLGGRPGYLATIQHSGENATINGINGTNSWVGGSDSDVEGTFRWKGNDTNSIFRTGGADYRGRYSNWNGSEPNDSGGAEDFVEQVAGGVWNDCGAACSRSSYIVEFDPMASRTVTNLDFQRDLSATANSAKNLGLGTSFINTSTWANGEIVRVTLTASTGNVAYTAGSTTLVSGASGSRTVTFEGSVANVNTALNTATVTTTSAGSSAVSVTYGVKRVTTGSYVYNSSTDHFYFANSSTATYSSAQTNAANARWAGTAGYLVTVTSESEHQTVRNLSSPNSWSGGSDSVSEGQWTWDSPDAYQVFSDFEVGLGGSATYWDPSSNEPSGNSGLGNALAVNFGSSNTYWDDAAASDLKAQIYEFAPIDTTLTLAVTTVGAITITTPSAGLTTTNGTAYSLSISATGGSSPLSYSIASGTLPTGLMLDASTGVISGTTSGAATSQSITVRATDINGATATTGTFVITNTLAACSTTTSTSGQWTIVDVTSSGMCDWTVPTGVTSIDAFVVGGGGGGGADGGSGGGGGGVQPIAGVAVTPGEALSVTIGAGGVGASYTAGRASTNGGSSSLQRGATVIATAGGGSAGGFGPGVSGGAGGLAPKGFAGGAGGTGSATIGVGSNGKTGATSYFTGEYLEYGGGGGGGSYNNGSNTFAIPAGLSGGGNGCGSPTASTNTVGGDGIRGGGGGAGCAGDGGRTNGGNGGTGDVLLRYATDSKDAFPASIGTPAYRYIADNYQNLDSNRLRWIDASGNSRHSGAITGAPQILTRTNSFGASGTVRGVAGNTSEGIQFSVFSPTTTNKYTLFQVSRYWGSNRQRIIDGVPSNWLSGYWSGNVGVAYHGSWLTSSSNTGTNLNNWQLMTDQNTLFRQNGITRSTTTSGQSFVNQLAINTGYNSSLGEKSDFVVAEIILYDGELNTTQIRQVENYLARTYNLQGLDFNNTALGANGVGQLALSKIGTVSTGQSDRLTATWSLPSDNLGVTDFLVEYKKTTASTWSTWAHTASNTLTSAVITGLDGGTQYDVRVTPVDSGATNRPSSSVTQVATWASSTTALGSLPASPRVGTAYSITASVSSGATGTVNFKQGGTSISGCSAVAVLSGTATCSWTPTSTGSVSITAEYSGDSTFLASSTVSASSVTVNNALCTPTSTSSGRWTVQSFTTAQTCDWASLPSGVESVDVLVVGGGGGGGNNVGHGGAGGGSYYVERVSASSVSTFVITTGAGGVGGTNPTDGVSNTLMNGGTGGTSSITWSASTFSASGGAGGRTYWTNNVCGGSGGRYTTISAGGTGSGTGGTAATGGVGGTHSTSSGVVATNGGNGSSRSISGSAVTYGGGGGGGGWGATGGTGGSGGGGNGGNNIAGTAGTANTGGGGGGGGAACSNGGTGGSGIVIVRYASVPTITTQPTGASKSSAQSHTFSVTPSATGAVSGDFTYQWRKDGVDIAGATSSSYTINSLRVADAGDYSVVVKNAGSSGAVSSVTSNDATLTVNQASQTITFGTLADRVYGVSPITLSATSTSGLDITFASTTTTVCTVSGSTLTIVNIGTCSVTASQAGNVDYLAATDVSRSFTVTTKQLTISGMTASDKEYDRSVTATPSFTGASLVGVVGSDSVSINSAGATATFDNRNVGNGKTVTASGVLLSGIHASKYTLAQPGTTASITKKTLTVSGITANDKVYDGNVSATTLLNKGSAALWGVISTDAVTLSTTSATATFADKNVGVSKIVTIDGLTISGDDAGNYTLTQPTTTASITAKALTVSGITANNRVYNATNSATNQLVLGSAALVGVETNDSVTLNTGSATATFANKNVEAGKTVTIAGLTISGGDAGNYTLTQPTTTASITAKTLTVSGITADNRVYNATNSATALLNKGSATLEGVISNDDVTLSTASATATFATKTVDTNKTVFVANLTISGDDAPNYTLTQPQTTASITAKTLTVSGITADNRVYDATRSATALLKKGSAALVGVETDDVVTLNTGSATATFADKNIGTNKPITIADLTITGTDANNYTLTQPTTTATITAKALTVTGITANNKVYNQTRTASLNLGSAAFNGVIAGDNVTISTASAAGEFSSKDVGTGKQVAVSGVTKSGTDAGNYTITQPSTTASITPKELTVTGITASNRNYDGTTNATINTSAAAFEGVIFGDAVTIDTASAIGTFDDASMGTAKTVQISGVSASGNDASNYSITQPTTTADIAAKTLTVTGITSTARTYNGSNSATAQLNATNAALVGIENGDDITLVTSGISGTYDNENAGTNKTISISGLTISGALASNYTLVQPSITGGRINPKLLTVTGITANNKVYDGNDSATAQLNKGSAALSGVVSGDNVSLSTTLATARFVDRFVAGNKSISIAGLTISGTDSGNYQLQQPTTSAAITAKTLTVSGITANNRVYNGSDSADGELDASGATLDGIVGSDDVLLDTQFITGTFDDKNVGTNKTITIANLSIYGNDIGNYTLTQPTATASITKKTLTVSGITASNRDYNASNSATALLNKGSAALVGKVNGDDVILNTASATATFANKNVGTNKNVSIANLTISGADAANYSLTQPTTTATITKKTLTVSGITATTKIYDGNTAAALTTNSATLVGVEADDIVVLETAGATGAFASPAVATGVLVSVSGLTLSGTDATNYLLTQPTTTADILTASPGLAWSTPNDIVYGTILSATQLDATVNVAGQFSYSPAAGTRLTVGTHTLSVTFVPTNSAYDTESTTVTITVTAKELTVSGITANNRVYNATNSATNQLVLGSAALVGVETNDSVTLNTGSATATFANKNVEAGKTVTIAGLTISGGDATNYTLTQPTTTASITAKTLTVSGITADNRVYNATNSATALLNKGSATLEGVISNDDVTLSTASATATFATKTVDTNKTVFVANLTISGDDAPNYTLTQPQTTASITAKELTVSGITADNRVYDATRSATALLKKGSAALVGVETDDVVTLNTGSATATFADKNIGTNKPITIADLTITGTDANNYTLTQPTTTATITAKALTVTGITANNRVYDATRLATTLLNKGSAALVGVETDDVVTLSTGSATATFADKNIGTNKPISIANLTISGGDSGNYTLTQPSTTASITKKTLTVSGITANDKDYDGNTIASLIMSSPTLEGVETNDAVILSTASAAATFADANVGTNKPVTISGLTISGTDSGNYQLLQPSATASINQASAGLTWANPSNITFGTSLSSTQLNAAAQVGGAFTYSPTSGTRLNAGTHTLSVTFTPTSNNYAIATATVSITVTAKSLTVSAVGETITYGTSPQTQFTVTGLADGDTESGVTYTYAGTSGTSYSASTTAPVNAGSYSVTPSALTLSAGLVSNYDITYVVGALSIAKATQQPLTAVVSSTTVTYAPAPNKTTVSLSSTGGSGDGAVTYSVASGNPCTINGTTLTVDGAGTCSVTATKATSANYESRLSSAVVITINKAAQTLSLDEIPSKTYGDSDFSVTTSATSGLTVSVTASPSSVCEVVSGHTIRIVSSGSCTVSATQTGDANWQAATVASGSQTSRTFTIAQKVLTISGATTSHRVYDGTTSATSSVNFASASLDGIVGSDSVSLNTSAMSAAFATKTIGTAKPITVSGLSLSGTHAHRYILQAPTSLSANVTALAITVSGIDVPTRIYDGTTTATLATVGYTFNGTIGGDSITLNDSSYTATYNNAGVGTSKTVTVSGLQVSGPDAVNYTLVQPTLLGSIAFATAEIIFGPALSAVYNGTPRAIAASTSPPSLSVSLQYNGTGQTSYSLTSTPPTNAGSYQAAASIVDLNYQGTNTSPWSITKQVVSVTVDSNSLTQTFNGLARSAQTATSPSGKNVVLTYTGINGTSYQSSWAPTNAGTYQVVATVVEPNFQGTITETLTIQRATQSSLQLANSSSFRFGSTLQLMALGGSGSGAISYATLSGPCTVNNSTGVLTASDVGICSVRATRAESMNYNEASSASFSVSVLPGTQTVSFTSILPSSPAVGSTYTPTALATSGLSPTVSITVGNGSVCSMATGVVTFVASGVCTITASQSGTNQWLAATSVSHTIEIGKLSQYITFPQPAAVDLGSPDFMLDASTSSGLPLTYQVTQGGSTCSVTTMGIISVSAVGTCTIEVSQSGNSSFAAASSMSRTLSVLPSLPGAPHITSISSGDGTVTVGFSAPHSNGGSSLMSYSVIAESAQAPTVTKTDCSALLMSCTVIGLVNGASYNVSVAATNARGTGPSSESTEISVPSPTISAARNIVGTRANTQLTVAWEDPNSYGDGTFVKYEVSIKKRSDASFGTPVIVQPVQGTVRAMSAQSHSAQFSNVDPSAMYETKIVTITNTVSVETSANKASAIVMPLNTPSAPRTLTVESPNGTTARISWRIPETDGGSTLQSYIITTSHGTCTLASPLSTSCTVESLQRGTSFTVSVRAVNAIGQSIASTHTTTMPSVPGAPTIGVMVPASTSANVSWSAPASNGGRPITAYVVDASEVAQPSNRFQCTTSGLSCVVTGLKSLTQYSFTVTAINSVGAGNPSTSAPLTTGRPLTTEWDTFRTTTTASSASALRLPPAPARVTSQRVNSRRTQVTAVRSARDADIPVTYALISVLTRTNKLLARIKVLVDPQNPATTVSVPYASSRIKVLVQFANEIGLSPGGPAGINVSEGNTVEWTTVAGTVTLAGTEIPGGVYFAPGSSRLTNTAQVALRKIATTAKKRGGLVYVTGFTQRGERKSSWMLEPLARARAEAVAKYMSRLGVRQWITFHGTTAKVSGGWKPLNDRRVVVTTVYPSESSPTVTS